MTIRSTFIAVLIIMFAVASVQFGSVMVDAAIQRILLGNVVAPAPVTVVRNIFFGFDSYPSGKIVSIAVSTFTRTAGLTLAATEPGLQTAVIDSANSFAYFGCYASPGKVVKVNLSTFTEVGTLTLSYPVRYPTTSCIDTINGFAYFGGYTPWGLPGQTAPIIAKIRLSDFTIVDHLDASFTSQSTVIDSTSTFAYFGIEQAAGSTPRIYKIDLATFSIVANLSLTPDSGMHNLLIDGTNLYAVVGDSFIPSTLHKIDLTTFTKTASYTFQAGERYLRVGTVNTSTHKGYFGGPFVSKVIEIDLSTMTRGSTLSLSFSTSAAVIDDTNTFTYFANENSPVDIYKIDLSNLSLNATLGLSAAENLTPYSGVFWVH